MIYATRILDPSQIPVFYYGDAADSFEVWDHEAKAWRRIQEGWKNVPVPMDDVFSEGPWEDVVAAILENVPEEGVTGVVHRSGEILKGTGPAIRRTWFGLMRSKEPFGVEDCEVDDWNGIGGLSNPKWQEIESPEDLVARLRLRDEAEMIRLLESRT